MSVACERALTQFGLARKFHIAVEMSVARERALTQACLITFLKGLSNGRNECCP